VKKIDSKLLNWVILITLALIWGTSFILIKRGLRSFSSTQVASLRVFITYLVLLPVSLRHIRKVDRNNIASLLIIGIIGNALPAYLYPAAQTRIDSTVAGMLNSLTPVFTLFIGIFIYKRKATLNQVSGIILGLIGAAGLLYRGDFSFDPTGLLIVLATLFYGISSNQVTRIKGMNGLVITSLAFFFIGPVAGINLLMSDFTTAIATDQWLLNLGYIALLAVIGSAFALAIFNILIIRTSPVFAVSVTYLAPVVSTMWGKADGEFITPFMIISVFCILAGVYLSTRNKRLAVAKAEITHEL